MDEASRSQVSYKCHQEIGRKHKHIWALRPGMTTYNGASFGHVSWERVQSDMQKSYVSLIQYARSGKGINSWFMLFQHHRNYRENQFKPCWASYIL